MYWIRFGDNNMKYFHTSTLIRRRRNIINALKDDCSEWVEDSEKLKEMTMGYFSESLTSDEVSEERGFLKGEFPIIENEAYEKQGEECSEEEVKRAPRGMGSYKEPGPYGYHAIFFMSTWELTGPEVFSFVKEFLEGGRYLKRC